MASFKPFISSTTKISEFTLRAIILGILLGLLFGIGNAYLALKVGTTVSASIPAAVLSMTLLRFFFKNVSILENNLVQTIASVGEALAAGVIFTVPALFLLGEEPSPYRIFLLSALGGVLGVLFMIPMRRYIIVQEHGKLPFPEGTVCAEILKSGESSKSQAILTIYGIIIGALHKIGSSLLLLWKETPSWIITPFQKAKFSIDCTPSLLGVGFIVGPRIASIVFAGGAFAWYVIIPLIRMFGEGSSVIIYPGDVPISQMGSEAIWSHYVRYIGAGTVTVGGLISLIKIAPLIGKTIKTGCKELFDFKSNKDLPRTDRDIPLRWLIIGSLAIILALWLIPNLQMNFLTIALLAILGFFFVAVTSITVGIVGSSSNPVSGMTITTLLITCLIFVALGWTDRIYLIAALTMSIVTNVAITLASTTSQDLKTGFLLGATPRYQQLGEIIGVVLPAFAVGSTLFLLDKAYGFGTEQLPAPQGTMMALIANGVIRGDIPTTLVIIGIVIGLFIELLRLPVLPFAIGLYLPLSLTSAMMVGGIVSAIVKYFSKSGGVEAKEKGILASSGLVAGDACMGVVIALLSVLGLLPKKAETFFGDTVSILIFAFVALLLIWFSLKREKK